VPNHFEIGTVVPEARAKRHEVALLKTTVFYIAENRYWREKIPSDGFWLLDIIYPLGV